MAEPYLSEIRIFSFNFAPKGWTLCNGQLLSINQNQALFSLLGTTYGGDGRVNFALPNLQGRVPIHMGNGFTLGQSGGEETHKLYANELPYHTHQAVAGSYTPGWPGSPSPKNNFWPSNSGFTPYSPTFNIVMNNNAIGSALISTPHNNMAPYQTLIICIATEGIFPSQS